MKRLLAYLFIVLSLGLTFSVSANAKDSYVEGICIVDGDKYQGKYQVRLNTKRYPYVLVPGSSPAFLNFAAKTRLIYEHFRAKSKI